jgi:hypothetical protein
MDLIDDGVADDRVIASEFVNLNKNPCSLPPRPSAKRSRFRSMSAPQRSA